MDLFLPITHQPVSCSGNDLKSFLAALSGRCPHQPVIGGIPLKLLKPLPGRFFQHLPVIGVRYADEVTRALPQVAPVQVGNAVFSYYIMHMAAGGYHASARLKKRYNSG